MSVVSDTSRLALARDDGFAFVQSLAVELSSGEVELPGFPEVAARIQRVLSDEDVSADRVVRVLSTEPVLAKQVLHIANSVALNPLGRLVTDLRTAVTRVGLNTVRSATIAYAVRQLRGAEELKPVAKQLEALWHRNVLIASLCFVVARKLTRVNPDTALLTGLLHGVGRLYLLTRACRHRSLLANLSNYQLIERDWHLNVATALLQNWNVPEEIVQAVRDCEDYAREPRGQPSLTDVLVAANLIAIHQGQPELLAARIQGVRAVSSLQLTGEVCEKLVEESAAEIAALREALN